MLQKIQKLQRKLFSSQETKANAGKQAWHASSSMAHSAKATLATWQKTMRSISTLIPLQQKRHAPLLTAAQPFGHEWDRFRHGSQSMVAWNDKQTQVWRIQGFLRTEKGRPLGFQLTFYDWRLHKDFLGPVPAAWVRSQMLAAHLSIIDPSEADPAKTYLFFQKGGFFSASKGHIAGELFHLELDGWYAHQNLDQSIDLYAQGLHLELKPQKPLTLHGQEGYAQRGPKAEDAAFHCSYSRLEAKGRFLHGDRLTEVTGTAWVDHEKLTMPGSVVAGDIIKRHDQFAIQLESGEELLISLHRQEQDGNGRSFASGTWIDAQCQIKHLIESDIVLETKEHWISPETGIRYPLKRSIRIEALDLNLDLRPMIPAQEASARRSILTNYWSGLHAVTGTRLGRELKGQGFTRLEGYDAWLGARIAGFLTRA